MILYSFIFLIPFVFLLSFAPASLPDGLSGYWAADYCAQQADQLRQQGFRVEVDGRNEKIGKKIREATLEKIPFMLVVGDRDMEAGTVSVRTRTGEDLGAMTVAGFTAMLHEVVDQKLKK